MTEPATPPPEDAAAEMAPAPRHDTFAALRYPPEEYRDRGLTFGMFLVLARAFPRS